MGGISVGRRLWVRWLADLQAATIAALQERLADTEALTYTHIGSAEKLLLPA